jgi:hypothetical protein
MSALIAVGINPHQPTVTKECAEWAIGMVSRDVERIIGKFTNNEVGTGELKQESDFKRMFEAYFALKPEQRKSDYKVPAGLLDKQIVPWCYLRRRCRQLTSFRGDKRGENKALTDLIKNMVDSEVILAIPMQQRTTEFKTQQPLFVQGPQW